MPKLLVTATDLVMEPHKYIELFAPGLCTFPCALLKYFSLRPSHHLGIHTCSDQANIPGQLKDQFRIELHVRHVGRKMIRIEGESSGRIVDILRIEIRKIRRMKMIYGHFDLGFIQTFVSAKRFWFFRLMRISLVYSYLFIFRFLTIAVYF